MKGRCTRGFGKVEDPKTGEEIVVEGVFEVDEATFERLEATYSGMERVESGDDSANEPADEESEEFRCGVNDCSRTVDTADATCWQH